MSTVHLEDELANACYEIDLPVDQELTINYYLNLLKNKHPPTCEHSIRVGLLSVEIAKTLGTRLDGPLLAGTLHDIGKLKIETELLEKTNNFTQEDLEKMKQHVKYGYFMLKPLHPYTAEIVLRHHTFQKNPYPETMPPNRFSEIDNLKMPVYASIIAMADFYDALTTRANNKFGTGRIPTPQDAKKIMIETNPTKKELIEELFERKIFKQTPLI